jgi:hypothetical protein
MKNVSPLYSIILIKFKIGEKCNSEILTLNFLKQSV